MTSAGSRLLAQRLAAPLTDPDAIDARLDAVELFVGDAVARQQTRELLHIAPDMARALSRLVVGRGGPRDLAAIRDGIGGGGGARRAARHAAAQAAGDLTDALAALLAPDQALCARCWPRSPTSCRCSSATAASCATGYDAALDESRALRDESRQVVAAAAGALRRRDRRQVAEDPAQQRARLFRRGDRAARREAARRAAQRHLHPPPDAGRAGALHHHRARRAGGEDRQRRRPRAQPRAGDFRAARRRGDRRRATRSRPPPRRSPCSTCRRRSPTLAVERGYVRPEIDRSLDFVVEGGRHPVVEQALMQRSVRRQRLRSVAAEGREAAGASGCSPARTWRASRPSCARTR